MLTVIILVALGVAYLPFPNIIYLIASEPLVSQVWSTMQINRRDHLHVRFANEDMKYVSKDERDRTYSVAIYVR